MKKEIIERVLLEANEIITTNQTIREIAKKIGVSKSTVHKDLHERLIEINENVYKGVQEVLDYHTSIRHIKGGETTRKRYSSKIK